ncbi:sulfite oxidase heme-binding subunit YedZ [Arcobacter sp. LA11]|uniref:sulfite oxidase heme-binding subunit YedZ n=1 Tax=Arcobacter sp. LA11 TaxID=1898176 RepID=UPI0009324935|nr:ferric reductase-like transmembrane domain-containing protein [Arcobacter sp. LA11]
MKRVLLFIVLLIPLGYLSFELFIIQDVKDPIKYIYTVTGATATVILFATISLSLIKKWINLIKYRRMFGLFGFFYALLHFLNFFILDAELDFSFVVKETLDKPFIYLGMISLFILIFMAITSTKKLFRKYNKYHKSVYIALILITIHFIMAQKSLSILQLGYVVTILIIAYCKLLQQIINKNRA